MRKLFLSIPVTLCLAAALPASAQDAATGQALAYTHEDARLQWGPCPDFLPEGCAITVLHGDPTQPNVDVFFRVPAGSAIARHTHTSAERMVLVSGAMEVTYDGQAPVTLEVGQYAYGPAGVPHEATCAQGAPCVLFIAFEEPLDAMPSEGEAP